MSIAKADKIDGVHQFGFQRNRSDIPNSAHIGERNRTIVGRT
jgi:hypothetical protein